MSMGLHNFFRILIPGVFLLGGMALFLVNMDRLWWGMGYLLSSFLVGEMGGIWFSRSVPVRCTECEDRADYFTTEDDGIYFRCRACGHVQKSGFSDVDMAE